MDSPFCNHCPPTPNSTSHLATVLHLEYWSDVFDARRTTAVPGTCSLFRLHLIHRTWLRIKGLITNIQYMPILRRVFPLIAKYQCCICQVYDKTIGVVQFDPPA